jgi:GntR family transcriptional regulator, transcriptional repressor for pyruvate dehydrogenase complex
MASAETSVLPTFHRVHSRRLFEEICEQIRKRIAAGILQPGDRLPAEREMAAGFCVSRPAVREALRSLENAGVVRLVKGAHGGAYILPPNPMMLTRSMQDLLNLGAIDVADFTEARIAVNEQVLKLTCERRTEGDLAALEETLGVLGTSDDLAERADAGARFFTQLARAAGNPALELLMDSLTQIVRQAMSGRPPRSRPELQPLRHKVLRAVRARDVQSALRAMREYVRNVHARTQELAH